MKNPGTRNAHAKNKYVFFIAIVCDLFIIEESVFFGIMNNLYITHLDFYNSIIEKSFS